MVTVVIPAPPQRGLAVVVSADTLWGTDSCVIKPHFSITLSSTGRMSGGAGAPAQLTMQTWTRWLFLHSPVHVMDQIQQGTQGKMCTCRIYAFLLKGWGEGRLFTFGEIFIGPFPTVSVWF